MLDMNAPKMTAQDAPLFLSLVEDLFPNVSIPQIDYSKVCFSLTNEGRKASLFYLVFSQVNRSH